MYKTYEPSWNSLKTHVTPQWFKDAKFGIYTHWGIYSVPARGPNGTWYPYNMYRKGTEQYEYHVKTYGLPSEFGYKDFIPMLTGEHFHAEEWAELFKKSGAQFAGPVGEHHDGFAMWDSRHTEWNAVKMGPKRDVVGELEQAIREQGMRFMIAMHHAENWWFFPHWEKEYDTSDPRYAGLYGAPHNLETEVGPDFFDQERPSQAFLEQWKAKIAEVVDNYRPDLIWFDFGLGHIHDSYQKAAIAHYYNRENDWQKDVVVTYKIAPKGLHNLPPGVGVLDLEVGKMNELTAHPWITDTSVDAMPRGTWCYVKNAGYKSVERLVHNLVDRVSKNGHLLLNVGPRPDGTIPEQARECLLGIGKWLEVNGEAIYDTVPWHKYGEGPTNIEGSGDFNEDNEARFTSHDLRFTIKDDALYVTCLGCPGDKVNISSLNMWYHSEIQSVKMLGIDQELAWSLDDKNGLTIETPQQMPGEHAYVFKIVRSHPF